MDGTDIAIADHNGIVNGIHSLIKDISVKVGDKKVYDCSDVNHSVNIKNLLESVPARHWNHGTPLR